MEVLARQMNIFGDIIKDDVWSLKLNATKGNKEKYFETFDADINEWLKDIPDRKKVERFKSRFYSSLFNESLSRGLYENMTAAEIYGCEYEESNMGGRGLFIFEKWFYEDSYIHLHGYEGIMELMVSEIYDDCIVVTHRFGADRYCKRFSNVEELKSSMWSIDDVLSLDDRLPEKTDKDLWFLYSLTFKVRHNFNLDDYNVKDYLESLDNRCSHEIRRREYLYARSLSDKELLKLVGDSIYESSWDYVKESIDANSKQKALRSIADQKNCSGGTFSYKRFNIGITSCDTRGLTLSTKDGRKLKFSWNMIYDSIHESRQSQQINLLSMLDSLAVVDF